MFGGLAEFDESRVVGQVIEEILHDIAKIVGGLQKFFEFGQVSSKFFHII
jgi:hypothetical protein